MKTKKIKFMVRVQRDRVSDEWELEVFYNNMTLILMGALGAGIAAVGWWVWR